MLSSPAAVATASFSHYIFGYGSLICSASRAVTAPTLVGRPAIPARVKGLERIWSLPYPDGGATFMGIRVRRQAECVGVLIPVDDTELAQFDLREIGYDRVPVPEEDIQRLPYEKEAPATVTMNSGATVWVYVQQELGRASEDCPIAQTYLDVILRGCLSISEDFARDFVRTTRGWHLDDHEHAEQEHHHHDSAKVHWVDDRSQPIYVRADPEYSKAHAHVLDRILEEHRPEWIHRRTM
jgi:hypothetical protein